MRKKQHTLFRTLTTMTLAPFALFIMVSCASSEESSGDLSSDHNSASETSAPDTEEAEEEQSEGQVVEESCDWDSPRLSAPAEVPAGQDGELAKVLVGSWQHTHTDEGAGFEEVENDHRYVFTSPERMLYCQHVPGATEHEENAADVVLNGAAIELPGGKYAYTVTAWDQDTLVWDNPVGGGYVYLLQRR